MDFSLVSNKRAQGPIVLAKSLVAIGKPELHVHKASHCGSKQKYSSHAAITLLLLVCATYTWCCSSRTFHSWWTAHSVQRQRKGCCNSLNLPHLWRCPWKTWNLKLFSLPTRRHVSSLKCLNSSLMQSVGDLLCCEVTVTKWLTCVLKERKNNPEPKVFRPIFLLLHDVGCTFFVVWHARVYLLLCCVQSNCCC